MTNLRAITTVAATIAVAATLLVGVAPAQAATTLNFPPSPIHPGPSVPPLPPGDYRPAVKLPTCDTILTFFPGVNVTDNWGNPIAQGDQIPRNIALAERHVTCVYQTGGWTTFVTIASMPTADYNTVHTFYTGVPSARGGSAGEPGYAIDTHYYRYGTGPLPAVSGDEQEFVSPDGWWVSVSTLSGGSARIEIAPIIRDAVTRLLAQNPLRQ